MRAYSTRNSFYLRISKNIVLPIYIYLDERHVNWMSDKVLQHVLSDLRPHILPKLKTEADSLTGSTSAQKQATVDTHRGDNYQFCYFIRKTEPHSVLIKSRNFTLAPQRKSGTKAKAKAAESRNKRGKRKEITRDASPTTPRIKKRRTTRRPSPETVTDDDDVGMVDTADADDEEYLPARKGAAADCLKEDAMELEIEDEEEKPKPMLGLTYQGFNIYGQCLCVVVEPWPVVRSMTVPPSLISGLTSQTSLKASLHSQAASSNIAAGAQVPLFLPEEPDGEENEPVGNRSHINQPYLNQVLNAIEISDDEDDMGGMMEFSQVLNNIGDARAGAVNDDDDMDGSILFGDADEFKEL